MRAAVLRELGRPLEIEKLQVPKLGRGQLLVRMQLAAVCHSQKLEVSGGRGPDRYLPHLIGHEGVGVVEEAGPGVTKAKEGDQVVLSWIRGSGWPSEPIRYSSAKGSVNAGPISTFCEMPVVSEQCVTRMESHVDPEAAVLAGCALATGAGTVWNGMPASPEGSVCIIGMGGVGLAAVCGALWAGWGRVIAVDLKAARLKRAKELGATHALGAGSENVEEAISGITNGAGCDLVVECAGSAPAMQMAVRIAKVKGGKVIIAGNLEAGKTISLDPFDLIKGRWLGGSWGGGINPEQDIPRLVSLVEQGVFNRQLLMGKRFPLEQVNEALRALDAEDPGRPILQFNNNGSRG